MTGREQYESEFANATKIACTALYSRGHGEIVVGTAVMGAGHDAREGFFTMFLTRVFGLDFPDNREHWTEGRNRDPLLLIRKHNHMVERCVLAIGDEAARAKSGGGASPCSAAC